MAGLGEVLKPYWRRIMMMVARGVVSGVNDGQKMQILQLGLRASETREKVERFQEYGFTSCPHNGAEAAVVFIGGDRGHGLVLAVDDRRYRLQGLEQGEVALYTDEGDKIHLKRGNQIDIETKTLSIKADTKVTVDTPRFEVSGDIIDQYGENAQTVDDMREIYNAHKHEENPNLSGLTDIPNNLMD